jgi:hypothetical protein
MFCGYCGESLIEGAKFCSRCGKEPVQGTGFTAPPLIASSSPPASQEDFAKKDLPTNKKGARWAWWLIGTFAALVLVAVLFAVFGRGSRPPRLSVDQARRTAAELAGGPVQNVDFLFCPEDDGEYLAFTDSGGSVWLFRRTRDEFEKIWRSGSLDAAADHTELTMLPGEKLPAVRFVTQSGGTSAESTTLHVFLVRTGQEYWENYSTYYGIGVPKVSRSESGGVEQHVRAWFLYWAEQKGLREGPQSVGPDSLAAMEEAWIQDNRGASGPLKIRYFSALTDTASVGAETQDEAYVWRSYFKSGVVGFRKDTQQYFMVYAPESQYEWIGGLRWISPWLYMQPGGGEAWTLRFNIETSVLERGDFNPDRPPAVPGNMPAPVSTLQPICRNLSGRGLPRGDLHLESEKKERRVL